MDTYTPDQMNDIINQAALHAHDKPDVDSDRYALHHTLGSGPTQAAPGNHDHDARYDARYDKRYVSLGLPITMRGSQPASQSVPNATFTNISGWSFTNPAGGAAAAVGNRAMWTPSGGKWTVPADGFYAITFNVFFVAAAGGVRAGLINVNNVDISDGRAGVAPAGSGDWTGIHSYAEINLFKNDLLNYTIYQSSGAALGTVAGQSTFVFRRISEIC